MCGDAAAEVSPEEPNEMDIGDYWLFPIIVCICVQEGRAERRSNPKSGEGGRLQGVYVPWQADVVGCGQG